MGLFFRKKHDYIRSKKLLQIVSELSCQICGVGGNTQAAHTNWGSGKGRGIKADDNKVAALCQSCHYQIDQGAKLSKIQRQELWWKAHVKTVEKICNEGNWPEDVPLPDLSSQ